MKIQKSLKKIFNSIKRKRCNNKSTKKELDANEDQFIVQSKEMISEFKIFFKKFCNDLRSVKIK